VQIDERALLDKTRKALQTDWIRAKGGVLSSRTFTASSAGALKAEFPKAAPLVQRAFLGGGCADHRLDDAGAV